MAGSKKIIFRPDPESAGKVRQQIRQSFPKGSKLVERVKRARSYARNAKADNTWRAYKADWQGFSGWCQDEGRDPLPATPETVTLYLAEMAERYSVSTLQRRLAAISQRHQLAGHEGANPARDQAVRLVMSGIRRKKGIAPANAKAPALADDVKHMVRSLPGSTLGLRDRALLLVGFAGAFRRSELVSLDAGDFQWTEEGLVISLRRSKTDQEGAGRKIGIPYGQHQATCPVLALKAWFDAAGITAGPAFRAVNRHSQVQGKRLSDKAVALVIKRAAAAAGLDASQYSGHSLRSGFATSAAAAGAPERAIMKQTGHRSLPMVRRYIRDGSLFRENAASYLQL